MPTGIPLKVCNSAKPQVHVAFRSGREMRPSSKVRVAEYTVIPDAPRIPWLTSRDVATSAARLAIVSSRSFGRDRIGSLTWGYANCRE
jgi:hypothetical protein